jgi:hypothetical protein
MLTEQKPPWAAKFGVPNWLAHQPVKDCDWSRPVKKASFLGSVRRMAESRSVAIENASSHSISRNSPEPRGPVRSNGFFSLAGL